jgi:hypothetical protein
MIRVTAGLPITGIVAPLRGLSGEPGRFPNGGGEQLAAKPMPEASWWMANLSGYEGPSGLNRSSIRLRARKLRVRSFSVLGRNRMNIQENAHLTPLGREHVLRAAADGRAADEIAAFASTLHSRRYPTLRSDHGPLPHCTDH